MYAKKLLNRTPARAVLVVAGVLLSFAFLREPAAVLLTFLLAGEKAADLRCSAGGEG